MEDDLQNLLSKLTEDDVKEPVINVESTPINDDRQIVKTGIITTEPNVELPKSVDTEKYFQALDEVTQEVLDACRSDRQEAQDIIGLFRTEINNATTQNRQPARMYVDGLVKALEVKTNINSTAVKMIETNAKMLAALKVNAGPNVQINNANVTGGLTETDSSLEKILSEPMTHEDDF